MYIHLNGRCTLGIATSGNAPAIVDPTLRSIATAASDYVTKVDAALGEIQSTIGSWRDGLATSYSGDSQSGPPPTLLFSSGCRRFRVGKVSSQTYSPIQVRALSSFSWCWSRVTSAGPHSLLTQQGLKRQTLRHDDGHDSQETTVSYAVLYTCADYVVIRKCMIGMSVKE